jgi:hypothetical protein
MNGFIAAGSNSEDEIITNDSFFNEIDPNVFRQLMRLDSSITNERVRHALIDSIANTTIDLQHWKDQQVDKSHQTLADVPASKIDGKSTHENDYQRAVFCLAKAELIERYQDYDSTGSGTARAEELEGTIDDYKRQAIIAIRRILAQPQSTIELI